MGIEMRTVHISQDYQRLATTDFEKITGGYVVEVASDELQRLLCDVPLHKLPEELQKIVEKTN